MKKTKLRPGKIEKSLLSKLLYKLYLLKISSVFTVFYNEHIVYVLTWYRNVHFICKSSISFQGVCLPSNHFMWSKWAPSSEKAALVSFSIAGNLIMLTIRTQVMPVDSVKLEQISPTVLVSLFIADFECFYLLDFVLRNCWSLMLLKIVVLRLWLEKVNAFCLGFYCWQRLRFTV